MHGEEPGIYEAPGSQQIMSAGLLGLGALAVVGLTVVGVRKLMSTQLPKVQKVCCANATPIGRCATASSWQHPWHASCKMKSVAWQAPGVQKNRATLSDQAHRLSATFVLRRRTSPCAPEPCMRMDGMPAGIDIGRLHLYFLMQVMEQKQLQREATQRLNEMMDELRVGPSVDLSAKNLGDEGCAYVIEALAFNDRSGVAGRAWI
jgi:hypothetical protein